MGVIYKLTFSSGKSYIGMTTKSFQYRFGWHKKLVQEGKQLLYKAWRKYGDPSFDILASLPKEELAAAEIKAIEEFRTLYPHGYNMIPGGQTSPASIPAIAKKISQSSIGKKMSEEAKRRMSESQIRLHKNGYRHPMLGRKHSEETKQKMRRKFSPEHIENIRLSHIGKKQSEEQKRKTSLLHTGRKRSLETKLKMSIAQKQRWAKNHV